MKRITYLMCMLFYIAVCGQAKAKKILLVPAQVPSHIFEMTAAVSGLVKNGHEVYITIGSAFNKKDKVTTSGVTNLIFKSDLKAKHLRKLQTKYLKNLVMLWEISCHCKC